ncbi:hypothetical protein ACHMW6_14680 [Pseudoduganella sp. UC29_106]|uniref:hypothetical protein n=1 Tax=Pseudoduganella sp. UC29_106 TaxID=3374553 RepID=UPI0037569ECF
MSLLMQALRKAERAKQGVQLTEPQHEQDGLQLAPIETDIQRAAAGSEEHPVGGPAFSLEPMEPALTAADLSAEDDAADIPVIPATEVVHDPVPPQARPGARRSPAVAARAAAEARLASDMPHGPRSPGGLGADEAPHAASPVETAHAAEAFGRSRSQKEGLRTTDPLPRTPGARMPGAGTDSLSGGFRGPAPGGSFGAMPGASAGAGPGATAGMPQSMRRGPGATRAASAASNRRLAVLVGLLVLILLAFGFIYFRAVGGRPGAALPPVPMLPPGTIAATPGGVPATVIPGVDATRPGAVPTPAVAAAPSPSTASPGTAPTTPALPEPSPAPPRRTVHRSPRLHTHRPPAPSIQLPSHAVRGRAADRRRPLVPTAR